MKEIKLYNKTLKCCVCGGCSFQILRKVKTNYTTDIHKDQIVCFNCDYGYFVDICKKEKDFLNQTYYKNNPLCKHIHRD